MSMAGGVVDGLSITGDSGAEASMSGTLVDGLSTTGDSGAAGKAGGPPCANARDAVITVQDTAGKRRCLCLIGEYNPFLMDLLQSSSVLG